jgi:hypothetical protein
VRILNHVFHAGTPTSGFDLINRPVSVVWRTDGMSIKRQSRKRLFPAQAD